MKSLLKILVALLTVIGCASTSEHPPVVLKSTWVHCWEICGKGDRLAAVSTQACICSNGGVIPFQGTIPNLHESSLFDKFFAFIKGE